MIVRILDVFNDNTEWDMHNELFFGCCCFDEFYFVFFKVVWLWIFVQKKILKVGDENNVKNSRCKD